jgi:hypothetical protein
VPHSAGENKAYIQELFDRYEITSALDVGPGAGYYADTLRDRLAFLQGLEIWPPYVQQYNLLSKYDSVLIGDVRELAEFAPVIMADSVIFGDVLEHMTKEEAGNVLDTARILFDYIFISVPIVHWPQGELEGNPHEVHVQEDISVEDALEMYGPVTDYRVFEQTATFFIDTTQSSNDWDLTEVGG